jgi:hypothetical protein
MMEAHDCNFHDALQVCINDRCPLHLAMRTLAANLKVVGFGATLFRAGDNFGFHMGSDESQCTCQWSPNVNGEPYVGSTRCEQDVLDEREHEPSRPPRRAFVSPHEPPPGWTPELDRREELLALSELTLNRKFCG